MPKAPIIFMDSIKPFVWSRHEAKGFLLEADDDGLGRVVKRCTLVQLRWSTQLCWKHLIYVSPCVYDEMTTWSGRVLGVSKKKAEGCNVQGSLREDHV